jgi:hypothetical protein
VKIPPLSYVCYVAGRREWREGREGEREGSRAVLPLEPGDCEMCEFGQAGVC